jgi:hypothetical protein
VRFAAGLALVLTVLGGTAHAADPHVHAGDLARIDLGGGAVVVKEAGPPVREAESRVGGATVITSRGRPLRLPDLRPGERVMVLCGVDDAGVHRATRIKIGGRPSPPPR